MQANKTGTISLHDLYLTECSSYDCIRWITAHGSISQLDGFFLRLRLGKWEEGLGGTGYHVACISGIIKVTPCSFIFEITCLYCFLFLNFSFWCMTETGRHSLEQHTRKSLSVKVGGIKCMVESHYISNQDFLEVIIICR
jgi:hypothetical protein